MPRTPSYARLNVSELEGKDPEAVRAAVARQSQLLLIEDDVAKPADVSPEWFAVADKVIIGKVVLKDEPGNTAHVTSVAHGHPASVAAARS